MALFALGNIGNAADSARDGTAPAEKVQRGAERQRAQALLQGGGEEARGGRPGGRSGRPVRQAGQLLQVQRRDTPRSDEARGGRQSW